MKVLYFAWLRERLNRDEEEVSPPGNVATIAQLMDWLSAKDEAIALAFAYRNLIRTAVNEQILEHDAAIAGAKTIAFFPPMTGG